MNKKITFIFLSLLILPIANALYTEIGNLESTFDFGAGLFNSDTTADNYVKNRSNDGRYPPLVVDLNNDGINEIIHSDEEDLIIYNSGTLDIVGFNTMTSNPATMGNIITYDILGDGTKKILTVTGGVIEIWSFNGSQLDKWRTKTISHLIPNYQNGDYMIKCVGTDNCVVIAIEKNDNPTTGGGGDTRRVFGTQFGLDTNGSQFTIFSTGAGQYRMLCLPKIRTSDIAENGDVVFSFLDSDMSGSVTDSNALIWIEVKSNGTIIKKNSVLNYDYTDILSVSGSTNCQTVNAGKYVTPPIALELNDNTADGDEIALGYMTDGSLYKIIMYENDSTPIGTKDSFFPTDSLGNMIPMQSVPSSGYANQVCTQGYQTGKLTLLCTDQDSTGVEYEYNATGFGYDIGNMTGNMNMISHKGTYNQTDEGNDELVNSFGVFSLKSTVPSLNLIYSHQQGDGILIGADVENTGNEDFILLLNDTIKYLDDGIRNNPAEIIPPNGNWTIDPCIDSVIKVGTTMETKIIVYDFDSVVSGSDNVSAKATIYYGDSNEQDKEWSAWTEVDSSTHTHQFLFEFEINKTISNGVIKLYGRDQGNPTTIAEVTKTFTVGAGGVIRGDCTTHASETGEEEEEEEEEFPETVGSVEAEQVVLQTELVNINNPEQGLLPNFYQGMLQFLSYMIKPLMIIAIAVLILLLGGLAFTSAKKFANK